MPELPEQMYCSQQICIPPAFPYLLRQYCKAAIRSQPTDLLRWSTAYWRCLSLNIPPPVKPRLEYPIPQCRIGLTPGWLKAFLYQLQGTVFVQFQLLWDHWIGACLQHDALIEVLVLGRFTDPYSIPWFHFVGLCAGYLTDSLTNTMILVCEILTEEPEGGSAMIPLEVFLDVYTYLASIEAGKGQTLRNLYFTDDLLALLREEKKKIEQVVKTPSTISEVEVEVVEEEEKTITEEETVKEIDLSKVVSCPDIVSDEFKVDEEETIEDLEKQQKQEQEKAPKGLFFAPLPEMEEISEGDNVGEQEEEEQMEEEAITEEQEEEQAEEQEVVSAEEEEEMKEVEPEVEEEETLESKGSVPTVTGDESIPVRKRDLDAAGEEADRLRALAELESGAEEYGEDKEAEWEEIAKLKKRLEAEGMEEIAGEMVTEEEPCKEIVEEEVEEIPGEVEPVYQDIFVDAVPGIGPVVPCEIVNAVVEYMKKIAAKQHGMVMPRNIRHFLCPPLEVLET